MRRLLLILILLCTASAFAQYADTSDVIKGILEDARRNLKEKRYSTAQYYCDKGLEIQSNNEDLLYLKAETFYKTNKYEDAIKFYNRTLAARGKLESNSLYGRAMAEYMLGSFSQAAADILKFQKKDTLWSPGYGVLFECYRFMHKADSAGIILGQIEKNFPGNSKNIKYRAELFTVRHQYDSASKYYFMYDSLAEPDYYAFCDHARVLIKTKEYYKADAELNKANSLYSGYINTQLLLAELLLEEKKYVELQSALAGMYGSNPDNPAIYLLYAKANFYGAENYTETLAQLEECFKRGGDSNAEAWYLRGCVKAEQKLYANAINDFEKAVKIDPYYAEALCQSGDCFFNARQYDDALNCFGRAIKMNPLGADSYEARGYYYLKMNKISKARADFEKAVLLKPQTAQFYLDIGITDVFDKNYAKAVERIDEALRLALLKKDSLVYHNAQLFKWTTLMIEVKTDQALQCIKAMKPADAQETFIVNYMKFMTYFASKKYPEVEEVFNSMDTSILYHTSEYINTRLYICQAKNDLDKWVDLARDFYIRNASNYSLLDNVIMINEESSKALLQHEQIELGDGLFLFKNIDSTMSISVSIATKLNREKQKKIIEELDKQTGRSKNPEVLYLIKARCLAFMNDKTAIDAFNKAIEVNPQYKTAYYFRGQYKKKKLKDEKGGEEDMVKSK